jgi:hypothetical protein
MTLFIKFIWHWYIAAALLAGLAGFALLIFCSTDIDIDWGHHLHISNPWSLAMSNVETSGYPVVKEAELRYAHLMFVQVVIDHLPKYVLMPAVLVGYAGFSLDLLLKRLRTQTTV